MIKLLFIAWSYLHLRQAISHYFTSGGEFSLSTKPRNEFDWTPPAAEQLDLDVDTAMGKILRNIRTDMR
jgi:hypothetical protein